MIASAAQGQQNLLTTTGGLWTNNAIWSAVPIVGDNYRMQGGTTTLDAAALPAKTVDVGRQGVATLDVVAGGSLTNSGKFNISVKDTSGAGTLLLNGGSVHSVGKVSVGAQLGAPAGTVVVNSGSLTGDGGFQVGVKTTGNFTMNGGILTFNEIATGGIEEGTTVINGGTLTAHSGFQVGNNILAAGSVVTMNDGLLYSKTLNVGRKADAEMTVYDGTIETGLLGIGGIAGFETATGVLDLLGGSITTTNAGGLLMRENGLLNIENDALLILAGNAYSNINASANSGKIDWDNALVDTVGDYTWSNGSGSYLTSEFDGTDTTVWVTTIPEPATIGLLGLSGLALFIRKRFMS
jgi:hypothetical protein